MADGGEQASPALKSGSENERKGLLGAQSVAQPSCVHLSARMLYAGLALMAPICCRLLLSHLSPVRAATTALAASHPSIPPYPYHHSLSRVLVLVRASMPPMNRRVHHASYS
jgi:hypothetical protein